MNTEITIYTDGSSLGNPGPGGWGVILMDKKTVIELGDRVDETTNNQMEMTAMVKAMEYLADHEVVNSEITIKSDSKYCIDGLTDWIYGWIKRDWKKADNKPVLNKELWQDMHRLRDYLEQDNKLFFEHVRAHVGEPFNERVDDIARELGEGKEVELYEGDRADYAVA